MSSPGSLLLFCTAWQQDTFGQGCSAKKRGVGTPQVAEPFSKWRGQIPLKKTKEIFVV